MLVLSFDILILNHINYSVSFANFKVHGLNPKMLPLIKITALHISDKCYPVLQYVLVILYGLNIFLLWTIIVNLSICDTHCNQVSGTDNQRPTQFRPPTSTEQAIIAPCTFEGPIQIFKLSACHNNSTTQQFNNSKEREFFSE